MGMGDDVGGQRVNDMIEKALKVRLKHGSDQF